MGTLSFGQQNSQTINKTSLTKIEFLKDLIYNAYTPFFLDNTFFVVKSIEDILLLIYAKENNSIISYNLINNQIISEIKNAQDNDISNFWH